MNVQECLNRLALVELNNTVYATSGTVVEMQKPVLIAFMNEALTHLYSKFLLKEESVFLECRENITKYVLTKEHLMTECVPIECGCDPNALNDKYLFDTPESPFSGNIIKVLDVIGADGFRFALNNYTDPMSLYTPAFNVLQVPYPSCGEVLSILYQAKHERLSVNTLEQLIELPEVLNGAFFAYVAHLAYLALQSEISVATSQKFFAKYSQCIDEVVASDAINNSVSCLNIKFKKNGWC